MAVRTEDHPYDYGEFEGVSSEGYGAGVVMLWDYGTWQPEVQDIDGETMNARLRLMEERQDFTERLLAGERKKEELPPGS